MDSVAWRSGIVNTMLHVILPNAQMSPSGIDLVSFATVYGYPCLDDRLGGSQRESNGRAEAAVSRARWCESRRSLADPQASKCKTDLVRL